MALIFRADSNGGGSVLKDDQSVDSVCDHERQVLTEPVTASRRLGEISLNSPRPEVIEHCRTLATQMGELLCPQIIELTTDN